MKYIVREEVLVWMETTVEADSPEEAAEKRNSPENEWSYLLADVIPTCSSIEVESEDNNLTIIRK